MIRKFLVGIVLSVALSAQAADLTGRVVQVADGDTISVVDSRNREYRIRFLGIDAPERGQAYGNYCRKNLASKIAGKTVDINYEKLDQYGRITGTVRYQGRNINLEQIQDGCAWFYRYFALDLTPDLRIQYNAAEVTARKERVGLWRDPHPMNPYDFRRSKR